jgi:hypothetical protein
MVRPARPRRLTMKAASTHQGYAQTTYPLYIWYSGRTGLWVPMEVVYLGACIALASRLVASPGRPLRDAARARQVGSRPQASI